MNVETVLGWTAIGAAAAIAGMIWPFRRGATGVVVNLLTGITGALLAALGSYLIVPPTPVRDTPARLLVAGLGALAALGLVHAAWMHRLVRRRESG